MVNYKTYELEIQSLPVIEDFPRNRVYIENQNPYLNVNLGKEARDGLEDTSMR